MYCIHETYFNFFSLNFQRRRNMDWILIVYSRIRYSEKITKALVMSSDEPNIRIHIKIDIRIRKIADTWK